MKIKKLAVIGGIGFLLTGCLVVWAGFSAFDYLATSATEVSRSAVVQSQVDQIQLSLKSLPKLTGLRCWEKAQSLFAVQPWIERTPLDNLVHLKAACLESVGAPCKDLACANVNKMNNNSEGAKI